MASLGSRESFGLRRDPDAGRRRREDARQRGASPTRLASCRATHRNRVIEISEGCYPGGIRVEPEFPGPFTNYVQIRVTDSLQSV